MTKKRRLIRLMRTRGLTAYEAAERLHIDKLTILRWLAFDREFIRAWEAISVVRAIDHILLADDLVRSGKRLTPSEEIYVENARGLAKDLIELGLLDAPVTERTCKPSRTYA